jgi:hypothetical protein
MIKLRLFALLLLKGVAWVVVWLGIVAVLIILMGFVLLIVDSVRNNTGPLEG